MHEVKLQLVALGRGVIDEEMIELVHGFLEFRPFPFILEPVLQAFEVIVIDTDAPRRGGINRCSRRERCSLDQRDHILHCRIFIMDWYLSQVTERHNEEYLAVSKVNAARKRLKGLTAVAR